MSELYLGKQTPFPTAYDPDLLQSVPFEGTGDQVVTLSFDEFTSLCPVTGQPDFGTITLTFVPANRLIESKSLKLFLGSFRNHAIFHESVVQTIFEVAGRLLGDVPLEVVGDFNPRGAVKIVTRRSRGLDEIRRLS